MTDIENNKKLKHLILHESIHAIFKRTKEECKKINIEDGTGVLEFYNNGQELGRGFNEGLTEWICQKAGYGEKSYPAEKDIIKILELSLGEETVMKFCKGDIRENVAKILKMNEAEFIQLMTLVDKIYKDEKTINEKEKVNSDYEIIELDKNISNVESILFDKYFKDEIESAINTNDLSEETMQRLYELSFYINGGKITGSEEFASKLPLKFKNDIYPEILKKYQENYIQNWRNSRQKDDIQDIKKLPTLYKKSWFQKLKETIKEKFKRGKSKDNQDKKDIIQQNKKENIKKQQFKDYMNNMTNNSKEYIEQTKRKQFQKQNEIKNIDELDS